MPAGILESSSQLILQKEFSIPYQFYCGLFPPLLALILTVDFFPCELFIYPIGKDRSLEVSDEIYDNLFLVSYMCHIGEITIIWIVLHTIVMNTILWSCTH